MTVGMIFACMSPSRTLEYVPATYEGGGPKEPLDPIEYVFNARTVGSSMRRQAKGRAAMRRLVSFIG